MLRRLMIFFIITGCGVLSAHPGHPEDEAFFSVIFYSLLGLAIPLVAWALIDSARNKQKDEE